MIKTTASVCIVLACILALVTAAGCDEQMLPAARAGSVAYAAASPVGGSASVIIEAAGTVRVKGVEADGPPRIGLLVMVDLGSPRWCGRDPASHPAYIQSGDLATAKTIVARDGILRLLRMTPPEWSVVLITYAGPTSGVNVMYKGLAGDFKPAELTFEVPAKEAGTLHSAAMATGLDLATQLGLAETYLVWFSDGISDDGPDHIEPELTRDHPRYAGEHIMQPGSSVTRMLGRADAATWILCDPEVHHAVDQALQSARGGITPHLQIVDAGETTRPWTPLQMYELVHGHPYQTSL